MGAFRTAPRRINLMTRAVATACEPLEHRLLLAAQPTVQSQYDLSTGGSLATFSLLQSSLLQKGFTATNYDLFLDVNGIAGDSTDAQHPGALTLDAFNWGADAPGSSSGSTGSGASKPIVAEPHFLSHLSKASPVIMSDLADGTHLATATLTVRKRGSNPVELLKLVFTDVQIGSYEITTATDGKPAEEYTLDFANTQGTYTPQNNDGSPAAAMVFSIDSRADLLQYTPDQPPLLDGYVAPTTDMFLNVAGIDGESTDAQHPGSIDIKSFEWAEDAQFITAGRTTSISQIHFAANVSKASPKLMQFAATGNHIGQADFYVRSRGSNPFQFLHVTLTGAIISTYETRTAKDGSLQEEFTLSFAHITLQYVPTDNSGVPQAAVQFDLDSSSAGDLPFAPTAQSLLDAGYVGPTNPPEQMFLQLDGAPSESTDANHPNQIEIESYQWGAANSAIAGGGTGGGAGKGTFQEIHFLAHTSNASPKLAQFAATARSSPNALFSIYSPALNADFYQLSLQDAQVDSYKISTAPDGSLQEEFTLSFSNETLVYTPFDHAGVPQPAVQFTITGGAFQDEAPSQRALLDAGWVKPVNDLFLDIDGIDGESTDAQHAGAIEPEAFEWDLDSGVDASSDGAGSSKASYGQLHFVSLVSKASPKLMQLMTAGTYVPSATFYVRKSSDTNQLDFVQVSLTDVTVGSYQLTTSADGKLQEEYTLSFNGVQFQYTPQDQTGQGGAAVMTDALNADGHVQPFAPPQNSLLDNFHTSSNDLFLKLPNIAGESTDNAHADQIELKAIDWLGDEPVPVAQTGGQIDLSQFHVVSNVSKASPLIMKACTLGTFIPQADLYVRNPSADSSSDFVHVILTDVRIGSYRVTTAADGTLLEEYTLSYGKIELDYTPQTDDGNAAPQVQFQSNAGASLPYAAPQNALLDENPATAKLDMFLKLDTILGESNDIAHKNEIEILAMDWGMNGQQPSSSGTGGGASKVKFNELHLLADVTKATPAELKALITGDRLATALLSVRAPGSVPKEFYHLALSNVVIGTERMTTALNGQLVEEITLRFDQELTQENSGGVTPPAISIDNVNIQEGDSGTTNAIFHVTLDNPSTNTITVDFQTTPGTATPGVDYDDVASTVTFNPGDTVATISVPIHGDVLDENDETFTLNLSNPIGATIANAQGTGTILNDDAPPTISVGDTAIVEGNAGITTASFTVSLSAPSGLPISVNWATAPGTATPGVDYDDVASTITFNPGDTVATVNVPIHGDVLDENNETFTLNLANASGATIARAQGTGTIIDDDAPPTISVGDTTITEGDTGITTASVIVSLSAPSGLPISVNWATAPGTAFAGFDYIANSGTIHFAPGNTSATINLGIVTDKIQEPLTESFVVNLSAPTNATIADGQGKITIIDDDAPPVIAISDASITEGNSGTAFAIFNVTLSKVWDKTITVKFTTKNGTAIAGSDYTAQTGTLTFTPGQTLKQIKVAVQGDYNIETNENFTVILSAPTVATIGDATGVGTIVNDDSHGKLQFSQPTYTVSEGGFNATITVTRTGGSTGIVSVDYATAPGTATAQIDYSSAAGRLTFAQGETSKTFTVHIDDDHTQEPNETVKLSLQNPLGGATLGTSAATLTILDNEPRIIATSPAVLIASRTTRKFTGVVASFTDPDFALASNFKATIKWGDGTTSLGTIAFNNTKHTWDVSATHTYPAANFYLLTVTITDGNSATGSTSDVLLML